MQEVSLEQVEDICNREIATFEFVEEQMATSLDGEAQRKLAVATETIKHLRDVLLHYLGGERNDER